MIIGIIIYLVISNGVQYFGTNVYQPLTREEVKFDNMGRLYILSFSEAIITIYASDGTVVTRIGRKGNGPGEFIYPVNFWVSEDHVFVFDINNSMISKFDVGGTFIETWRAPERNLELVKVKGGWFYFWWGHPTDVKPTTDVIWANDNFEEKTIVCQVDSLGFSKGVKISLGDDGEKGTFSPIDNRPQLLPSADSSKVYLTDTQSFRIRVLSPYKKMVIGVIELEIPSLPFNKDWAEESFKEMVDPITRAEYRWTKNYPEKFPPIRSLTVTLDGFLVVDRWRGYPDGKNYYLTLNSDGEEVEREWNPDYLKRVVGKFGDMVYVTAWDDQRGEASVIALPSSEVDAFIQASPIKFDGPISREIKIFN